MTGEEVKEKIDKNNELIEKLVNPEFFTLNNKLETIFSENEKLRAICPHEYENGKCKWCGRKEE